MKQIRFGQRPSFPEQAVEGGPGLRVGGQSGGEAGISAAQDEEAVPPPGPPGLRGAVTVEASAGRANRRPWAGVLRAPSGFGGERRCGSGSCSARRAAVRAPPRPSARLRVPGPGTGPPPQPKAPGRPFSPGSCPGSRSYAFNAVYQRGQKMSVSPAFTHPRSSDRDLRDSLSLPGLWEEERSERAAPYPVPLSPTLWIGDEFWLPALPAPALVLAPPHRPSWGQSASALLPNSIPIFTPVHQHHQVTSEKRDRPQETPPHQPPAGVCDVNIALMVQCWPCGFILASFLGLAMCVAPNRLSTKL